jgi:hypothetical protein
MNVILLNIILIIPILTSISPLKVLCDDCHPAVYHSAECFSLSVILLGVIPASMMPLGVIAGMYHSDEHYYEQFYSVECHSEEYHYADCHSASGILLNVILTISI